MSLLVLLVILIAVVVVVLVGVSVALVGAGRRRTGRADGRPSAPAPEVERPQGVSVGAEAPDVPLEEAAASTTTLERPESTASRLVRLRQRLAGSQSAFGRGLLALLSREHLDADTWEELEDALITADVGVGPTGELVEHLRAKLRVEGANVGVREALREELLALVGPHMDRSLRTARADGKPAVVLVVGVNGAGKTTSVGKIARVLVSEDKSVLMGAADTFRAAATEQLTTWGERVGVEVISGSEGSDPASVAFESVREGIARDVDVVLVDTAGRLQNKQGLMDELGKVKRVLEKQAPVAEVLLVLDATTGQNGLVQARVFSEAVAVTGIVLTKLDGSAKGGIVVAVQRELGVPVKFVGLGEGPDDLAPFDPGMFVEAILGSE